MQAVEQFFDTLVGIVWGDFLVGLLVATGLYLTIRLGLPQLRGFAHALQILRGRYDDEQEPGAITHFQALSAALSATVGLGNIAGVALAVGAGGPGALLWMWVCGFLGMATKSASCTLSVRYRRFADDGRVLGGPMYYIEEGLGSRWRPMAILFAGLVAIGSFGGGNMFQANQVAAALSGGFGIPPVVTGLLLAGGVGVVIVGGIQRIGRVAGSLVPAMVGVYILGALVVIGAHWQEIPAAFALIFHDAFTGNAVAGGVLGEVVRQGFRRGTFSNEAGLGSAPIAHAAARTSEPAREGLVALLEPFIDTILICTMTGLVIIFSGAYMPVGTIGNVNADGHAEVRFSVEALPQPGDTIDLIRDRQLLGQVEVLSIDRQAHSGVVRVPANRVAEAEGLQLRLASGVQLTTAAFDSVLTGFGTWFVSLAVFLFAFSTMISWSYYGEQGAVYLWGIRAALPFKLIFVVFGFLGAIWPMSAVVNMSDTAFGLMAFPNLIALWLLAGRVRHEHDDYFKRMHAAEAPPRR